MQINASADHIGVYFKLQERQYTPHCPFWDSVFRKALIKSPFPLLL